MSEQTSFIPAASEFADNPEPRCPCLLLLDTSDSMSNDPIEELNAGLASFKEALAQDSLAMKRVEVGIITFGPVQTELPFTEVSNFYPPTLSTSGNTPMGEAIRAGLDMVARRKDEYRANGISYYRPWIFLITDGEPTDEWRAAAKAVHDGEARKAFAFFAVGVQGANMDVLRQISTRAALRLDGLRFRDMFTWLSTSLRSVSHSSTDEVIKLKPPDGWTVI